MYKTWLTIKETFEADAREAKAKCEADTGAARARFEAEAKTTKAKFQVETRTTKASRVLTQCCAIFISGTYVSVMLGESM